MFKVVEGDHKTNGENRVNALVIFQSLPSRMRC